MYFPIVNPADPNQPLAAVPVTVQQTYPTDNVEGSYQAFDDLTTLTELAVPTNKSTKIPSDDEIGNVSFYNQNSITLPAVGSGFIPIVQFTVPLGYNGVLKKIENNITGGGFIDGSGDVIWQIMLDDVPAKNYDTILTERGDPNSPVGISPIFVYSGQTISYIVNHVTNPALTGYAIATLAGYFYPAP